MSVEIYIDDLKPDIQRQVLEELGLETAEDGNYDIIPLFSVERPELFLGRSQIFSRGGVVKHTLISTFIMRSELLE